MGNYYETKTKKERAILVALSSRWQTKEKTMEYLDELAFLATTAGANATGLITVQMTYVLD